MRTINKAKNLWLQPGLKHLTKLNWNPSSATSQLRGMEKKRHTTCLLSWKVKLPEGPAPQGAESKVSTNRGLTRFQARP